MTKPVDSEFSICLTLAESSYSDCLKSDLALGSLSIELDQDSHSAFIEINSLKDAKKIVQFAKSLAVQETRLFCATTSEVDNFVINFPDYVKPIITSLDCDVQVSVIFI